MKAFLLFKHHLNQLKGEANERVVWSDSPRERWRKRYARFVREIEWAFLELRTHVSEQDYERMVVQSATAIMRQTVSGALAFANGLTKQKRRSSGTKASSNRLAQRAGALAARLVDPSRFAHFLTYDGNVSKFDPVHGRVEVDVPDCAWHRVAPPTSLPVVGQLPEQGCLVMCKATCESVFDGRDGLRIEFEPRLPETGCTMRMSW